MSDTSPAPEPNKPTAPPNKPTAPPNKPTAPPNKPTAPPNKPTPQANKRRPVWNLVKFFVIPLAIIAIIGVLTTQKHDGRAEIIENGLVTQAVPTGNTVDESSRSGRHTVQLVRLEFSYEVDGKTYIALGDHSYDEGSFDKEAALAANSTAEVHYVEADPATAIVLDTDYR
ncbi:MULTISPECIES: DUF3592 domain-containing protein [unclassified Salinibacterium]|uniref:DUF3592 domain-containing protein n=1 Tax=unclassified Salinibacterium TaxID=2632331 RepID=UPI0018CD994B|nr:MULTISPECIES: DUF3592 domain-containing protein [unclassified Salinibacterium]MBH0053684.1 hypothetical protein [Salinibacterium sp. SWN139]MBH0082957.1 hypothetical protein [Salinibacterium sp. SWN167]